jgi:hypothetical protein
MFLTSAPVPGSPTPRELAWEFMGSFFTEETKNMACPPAALAGAGADAGDASGAVGLTPPDSVRNLIRRADRALLGSRILRGEIEAIRRRLPKTENRP